MNSIGKTEKRLSPFRLFPCLKLGRYRFMLSPLEKLHLPDYQGSTWRGIIGNALLDLFCPWQENRCTSCSNRDSCAYYYLYEAGSEEKAFATVPRPYIFSLFKGFSPDLCVDVTLVGGAGDCLPHLIGAWIQAGERGAGKGRGKFRLAEVRQMLPDGNTVTVYQHEQGACYEQTVFPLSDYLEKPMRNPPWLIDIESPLRYRKKGKNTDSPELSDLFTSLAIRLSSMNRLYCGGDRPDKEEWEGMKIFFQSPEKADFFVRWYDWERFSSRQQTHVPMGGIVGQCRIEPAGSEDLWWQWWQTAEFFHLGKGTSMGLGKITIKGEKI